MEMITDFYKENVEEDEDEFNESPYASILDLSDVEVAEIEIEDEIKLGYLWEKYHDLPK
ncbi:MAG: hypothetical protein ACTSP6_12155 [Promethearchaeota archaeon]